LSGLGEERDSYVFLSRDWRGERFICFSLSGLERREIQVFFSLGTGEERDSYVFLSQDWRGERFKCFSLSGLGEEREFHMFFSLGAGRGERFICFSLSRGWERREIHMFFSLRTEEERVSY
ncbi:MAG: hypothetical protein AB7W16_06775, partial [Candidatus Obscuribacterales bacterium]